MSLNLRDFTIEPRLEPVEKEPMPVTRCYKCKDGIYPGKEYAHFDGVDYCESCLEDMPLCVLVPLIGGEWFTAEGDDCA